MNAYAEPAPPPAPNISQGLGTLARTVKIGFFALRGVLALLFLAWLVGNIRQVPAESRVVVMRFGHVARVQEAGLVLAWPSPIEQITLLPGAARQLKLALHAGPSGNGSVETDFQIHQPDDAVSLRPMKDTMNEGYLLTGDGSVVQFDAALFYSIANPQAYVLSAAHVEPALGRFYRASAVALAARSELDDFLVARPERRPAGEDAAAARRARLAADMVAAINARLAKLVAQGNDLGIIVRRVDIAALLPPLAKSAFDSVLTVAQTAEQQGAAARTAAANRRQQADQDRDRALAAAEAAAQENIGTAKAAATGIRALAQSGDTPAHRQSAMAEIFRERIGPILARAGQVTTVDAVSGQHLVLLGGNPSGATLPASEAP